MMSAIGSRRATPAGFRVRALTAPAQLRASFFQAAVLKSGVVETAIGVWANRADEGLARRALRNQDRAVAPLAHAAGRAALGGDVDHRRGDPLGGDPALKRSTCSTPFCSTATRVSGPTSRASQAPVAAAS
jgi:hypothetical protein